MLSKTESPADRRCEKLTSIGGLLHAIEVRHVIAHDYSGAERTALLDFCRTREPLLNAACDRIAAYAPAQLGKK
ncbi:MAG: hypothetical protein ABIR80_06950 [Opitutaceae bacterium]